MWLVTRDMWHVTCDTWHVTCDTWHVTHDILCGMNILSKFQLSSSSGKNTSAQPCTPTPHYSCTLYKPYVLQCSAEQCAVICWTIYQWPAAQQWAPPTQNMESEREETLTALQLISSEDSIMIRSDYQCFSLQGYKILYYLTFLKGSI